MSAEATVAGTTPLQLMLPLEGLEPVPLEVVVAEAALMNRVDRKYLLPLDAAGAILREIAPQARVLMIGGMREFGYESVYFDTQDHLSYRLTAQRRRRRFKLRTRHYLDTGGAYLELKTKSGRGSTVKERIAYDPKDRARLTAEGRSVIAELLSSHGHDPALIAELRPALLSRYSRSTLLLPGGSRATIDRRLHWSTVRRRRRIDLPTHAIIESKSAGRPSELDRILWKAGHRPSGISKFGTGTAALHPHLPHNKWARTLGGAFADVVAADEAPPQGDTRRPHYDSEKS